MADNGQPTTLITGGSGFLGSHLCDRLISEGHKVICLDNQLTGSLGNVEHLLGHRDFAFVSHDVTEPIELPQLLTGAGKLDVDSPVDYVLHFASPASPKDYARHPIHTLKVGALGTYHALGLAKAQQARFLLASSSEVYGDPQVSPQPESYFGHVNPIGPRSVYDEGKRFAEALASAYRHAHGLDVRIARIFNSYGPRMRVDDGRAVPTFMAQALRGEPLTVYGNGSQTRSFCYVDDTVEGLYLLMVHGREISPPFPKRNGGGRSRAADDGDLIVNIGNPDEVTVLEIARDIIDATDSPSEIVFAPLPEDDPKTRRPDITRAKQVLGWKPAVSRHEGLKKLVPYFKEAVGKASTLIQPA